MAEQGDATAPGNRLLFAQHVDHLSCTQPNKTFISYAKSNDLMGGFRDVSWSVFANAVNRAAHWLDASLPTKRAEFETLAYIGESDIRYFIIVLAANKTRYKMLLPSPRNSDEGQLSLLEETGCVKLLRSEGVGGVQSLLDTKPELQCFVVPSLDELLDETPAPSYPDTRSWDEGRSVIHVIFHTSGSTGLPKPIYSPESAIWSVDDSSTILDLHGKPYAYTFLAQKAYFGNVAVIGPSRRPLSASLLDEMIQHGNIGALYSPPATLEEASKVPAFLENLSKLEVIFCATGPLSTHAGAAVAEKTHLNLGCGSTESYLMPTHITDPEDWRYLMINAEVGNIEWRKEPSQDLYELVYINDPSKKHVHAAFATFPDAVEFPTKDLFEKHPTKLDLWRLVGRRDDLIVLSTGEKLHPRPIEDIICGHPAVRSALVFGHGRFQIGSIIELREYSNLEQTALMDSIWEFIEKANGSVASYGRLVRHMVFFAREDKPFIRVGKGSISRPATIDIYQDEINAAYSNAESLTEVGIDHAGPFDDQEKFYQWMHNACEKAMGISLLDNEQDFFKAGADSIGVILLTSALKKAFKTDVRGHIKTRLVYEHTNVSDLSSEIRSLFSSKNEPMALEEDLDSVVNGLVDQCLSDISWDRKGIVLTGSTGSLGSHLLHTLVEDPTVDVVYCLNRGSNSRERQISINASPNLKKAIFLESDLVRPDLGLSADAYDRMISNTKYIIHCAWPLDINSNAATYQPLVQGVANLARFARQTTSNAPICFLSSIGTVQRWSQYYQHPEGKGKADQASPPVPETSHNDARLTASGYSLGKLAASTLLERAAAQQGVRSIIIRINQIAGPVGIGAQGGGSSSWTKREFIPSLIHSSRYMGILPDSLGAASRVDWTPVNIVAQIIWEMVTNSTHIGVGTGKVNCSYLHLANPHVTTWQEGVLPTLQRRFGENFQTVPLDEWIAKLKRQQEEIEEITEEDKPPYPPSLTPAIQNGANGVDTTTLSTPPSVDLSVVPSDAPSTVTVASTAPSSHSPPITEATFTIPPVVSDKCGTTSIRDVFDRNPAIKLLSTYESFLQDGKAGHMLPCLSTSKAQQLSPTLRMGLQKVDSLWVEEWLDQWGIHTCT